VTFEGHFADPLFVSLCAQLTRNLLVTAKFLVCLLNKKYAPTNILVKSNSENNSLYFTVDDALLLNNFTIFFINTAAVSHWMKAEWSWSAVCTFQRCQRYTIKPSHIVPQKTCLCYQTMKM